jgi:hypothetical protein
VSSGLGDGQDVVALKVWVKRYHLFLSALPGSAHHFPLVRTALVVSLFRPGGLPFTEFPSTISHTLTVKEITLCHLNELSQQRRPPICRPKGRIPSGKTNWQNDKN